MTDRGYMPKAVKNDWRTPQEVLDRLRITWGAVDLDPCPSTVKDFQFARKNLVQPEYDGLIAAWAGEVFVNPPFGDLDRWTAKCVQESRRTAAIILLLPSRTDTAYWQDDIRTASAICFWRGRLRFVGALHPCPFPVAFAYWGKDVQDFERGFAQKGMIVRP